MSKSGRPGDAGRAGDQPPKGSSSLSALFRNVLRSPFGGEGRNSGSARKELSPGLGSASLAAVARSQSTGAGHSPASIGEGRRLQLGDGGSALAPESADRSDAFSDTRSADYSASSAPVDSVALAQGCAGLADQGAAMGDRLEALAALVPELKGRPLANLGALWRMLHDIVELAFGNADAESEQRQTARRLVLSLMATFAEGGQSSASDVQSVRESMLRAIGDASGWDEIELAVQCATWASDEARSLTGDPVQWFGRARQWTELAVDQCYPSNLAREPLEGPPPGPHVALAEALAFLACIISADYPVLDPDTVSAVTLSLCEQSIQTRLISENGLEEVTWIWTEPVHLHGLLFLLKTVITYGALSQDVLLPAITLLCTTVNVPMCKDLCCEIVYTLFTSCYMRDTLLTMNQIMRKSNTGMNARHIYGMPSLTPYQAAVNGMVYYITQVMDTGPTGFQFSLRTGNCLPVLGEAAQCMHSEVLTLVFPYLCKVANDDRVDSMLADDWAVLIAILENTVDCRLTDNYDVSSSSDIDEENQPPTLAYLYDGALQAIVSVFRRSSQPTPTSLVNLLYKMRNVLSDELAQSMLLFIEARGSLRPGSSDWLETLEEMMHLYYFDRSRSTPLRRHMARMCARAFAEAFDVNLAGIERMPFIISVLDQLQLEEDEKIIDSVLEVLCVSLRRTKDSTTFREILGFAMRAAVEPDYVRPIQPNYRPDEPPMTAPTRPQLLLLEGDERLGKDEKTYSSWARVTLTSKCLLSALEWRVSITDTISDETYAHSAPDTIALVNSLLDLLQSEHTFPSVQRSILAVFLRFHADANLRLYILHSDHDTLLDQRVSLHENARLRLVVQNSCDTEDTLSSGTDRASFPIKRYLDVLAYLFQTNIEVETYSVLCSGLMEQLTNTYLFGVCVDEMQALIGYLISYMRLANYEQDTRTRMPPEEKNRISTFTYGLLASTMPYKDLIGRDHEEMLVIMLGDGLIASSITSETPRICLHALSILMLEIPEVLERKLVGVLLQLAKVYSAAQLSVHLLEFVSSISRNPRLYVNFRGQDYRLLFAVAINYIRFHNNQRRRESSLSGARLAEGGEKGDPRRLSAGASLSGAVDRPTLTDAALSQYVLVMAYQVIDVYYLSLSPALKAETLDHVLVGLLQANYSRSSLDEVNEVCLDMILQNYNRSSEDILSISDVTIKEDFGPVVERHWIQHNGIVTIRAQKEGPMAQIILRSSSGTTSRIVDLPAEVYRKFSERAEKQQPAASLPASPLSDSPSSAFGSMSQSISRGRSIGRSRRLHSMAGPGMSGLHHETDTLPQDSIARLLRGELLSQAEMSRAAHFSLKFGPAPCLALEFINAYQGLQNLEMPTMLPPNLESVARSLRIFDNTAMVDTHKVSVAYVGPGQTTEREILLNQQGSPAYWNFLRGLGTIRRLGHMQGFSAGLDTSGQDSDGRYTIGWRDLIAKLVFHVGTLMPAQEGKQEQITRKKAHMGNDYVHIVFNESGRDYEFETIQSQFNFVQIIVTPVDGRLLNRNEGGTHAPSDQAERGTQVVQLYKVKTQTNPNVPFIGPAIEPKVLALTALPAFVRSIAIHAAIFSQVFSSSRSADTGPATEYVSLWRARLQIIKRVRAHAEREQAKQMSAQRSQPSSPSDNPSWAEYGEPISDPSLASSAAQALGYLVHDLDSFASRE